jgi:cell division protein FtsB
MKKQRIHRLWAPVLLIGVLSGGSATAANMNDIFGVTDRLNAQAKRSQAKIDALTEETRQLLNDYKTVLKEIEGLRVYNRQLEKQIGNQEQEMAKLASSIDQVTLIERQITPLMLRMIDGLENFVELDLPFLMDERANRIEGLRAMMDRADVAVSEKFSQILRAYQIENEYGRTMEAYGDNVNLDGTELKADVLKVGRIALVFQTPDGEITGRWNETLGTAGGWEELDDSYTTPVRNGIRMARKQLSVDMLTLPIKAPEAAE